MSPEQLPGGSQLSPLFTPKSRKTLDRKLKGALASESLHGAEARQGDLEERAAGSCWWPCSWAVVAKGLAEFSQVR